MKFDQIEIVNGEGNSCCGIVWFYRILLLYSSFPVIHKVGNIGIFVLLKSVKKLDVTSIFFSKHRHKCKRALKIIKLITTHNLFLLEVVQKMPKFVYYEKTRLLYRCCRCFRLV